MVINNMGLTVTKDPIEMLFGIMKVIITTAMFFLFGWKAGIMAIILVIEYRANN